MDQSGEQFKLLGTGNILKVVLEFDSVFDKVGLDLFRIWGREVPLGHYKVTNKYLEKERKDYSLNRTLIGLGVNVLVLEFWERFDSELF